MSDYDNFPKLIRPQPVLQQKRRAAPQDRRAAAEDPPAPVRYAAPNPPPSSSSTGVRVIGRNDTLTVVDTLTLFHPPRKWRNTLCEVKASGRKCDFGYTCRYAHSQKLLRKIDDYLPEYAPVCMRNAPEYLPQPMPDERLRDFYEKIGPNMNNQGYPPGRKPPSSAVAAAAATGSARASAPASSAAWGSEAALTRDDVYLSDAIPAHLVVSEECLACMEWFADRRLQCGHELCSNCIAKWQREAIAKPTKGTTCPTCRQIITHEEVLPDGVTKNKLRELERAQEREAKSVDSNSTGAAEWRVVGSAVKTVAPPGSSTSFALEYLEKNKPPPSKPKTPTTPAPSSSLEEWKSLGMTLKEYEECKQAQARHEQTLKDEAYAQSLRQAGEAAAAPPASSSAVEVPTVRVVADAESRQKFWTCEECTFMNAQQNAVCAMCESPRE